MVVQRPGQISVEAESAGSRYPITRQHFFPRAQAHATATCQLGVELGQSRLSIVVEHQHSIDHL